MSNQNFPRCCLNSWLLFLPTADAGQNIAFSHFCNRLPHLTYPSCHCTKHNPNAMEPALTVVFCRPLVTLTVSLLHPLEIVSIFFLQYGIRSEAPPQLRSLLTGPRKGGSRCLANDIAPLNLSLWSLGLLSYLPLYLKSQQVAHNHCPAILNKTLGSGSLPG